ncbi:DNA damage-inducible protein D [Commensalibacter sp. Nvir]|uniref:DNA damage-inducible protein D n=1 Tax=Commensalibacter sp. Nvir TaxID=3069817 RepID=UPI0030C7C46B
MKDDQLNNLMNAFEEKVHVDSNGVEFWYARDLQKLFGYKRWDDFMVCIEKAQEACRNYNENPENYFQEIILNNKKKKQNSKDIKLSRYAAYLVAQNSNPKKPAIAFAHTYFAIQTRRHELYEKALKQKREEDQKRLQTRNLIKAHHKELASAAQQSGIQNNQDFSTFYNKGYLGLYNHDIASLKKKRNLPDKEPLLDHMGYTELAANIFRVTQTEEKLRRDNRVSKKHAFHTHYEVGKKIRQLMLQISGVTPENLPLAQDIKEVERQLPDAKLQTLIPSKKQRIAIDLRHDLWKYALLIMAAKPAGIIMTSELIEELPHYIVSPTSKTNSSADRGETRFPQLVRNLKSNRKHKNNFIAQGYAYNIKNGFQITLKGLEFVKDYFKDREDL